MKILLLGGNGQVGHELRRSLAPLGELAVTSRDGRLSDGSRCESLDLGDGHEIAALFKRVGPDVVVNAAAYTAVDRAEQEPELALRINAEAPARISELCAERDIALLHYSTDYVFDGRGSHPYRDDDPVDPLGVYGRSKYAGEQAIRASGARHMILRTAWVYGLHGHNFLRTMLRVGGERDELRVVADQIGSPTPAWLIADASAAVLAQGFAQSAIRHVVSAGSTSWHGFAEAIFDKALALGLIDRRPKVLPIDTSEYPTPAQRPAYSVLDTSRLREEYALELPSWSDALHTTLAAADRDR